MSLDLYLFAPRLGEDPADTYDDIEFEDDDGRPDAAAEERNTRLLDALQARHPEMRRHRSGKRRWLSLAREWRSVSLVGESLEIFLSKQYAVVTAEDENAAYEAARVISSVTGWQVFPAL